jgi:hypothetical protein
VPRPLAKDMISLSALREMRRLAEQTPAHRDRHVDLLRAIAIVIVVVGHWLAVHVSYDGTLRGDSVLALVPWTRPLTWLFQVMPVFFLVGGFANVASLASHRERGGTQVWRVPPRLDRCPRYGSRARPSYQSPRIFTPGRSSILLTACSGRIS